MIAASPSAVRSAGGASPAGHLRGAVPHSATARVEHGARCRTARVVLPGEPFGGAL